MDIVSLATIAGTVITALFASLGSMFVYLKKQGFFEGSQNMTDYMEASKKSGKIDTSDLIQAVYSKMDYFNDIMIDRFDRIDRNQEKTNAHLAVLNGRVGKHDVTLAVHEEKLTHGQH
jgi:hypothetical protein